mgnify:CR=1 FL=1
MFFNLIKTYKLILLFMYVFEEKWLSWFLHYCCQPILLSSADKSHSSVTSLGFNMQGDLLLVGHANGFLALWEISAKGGSSKPVSVEHNTAIMHTAFLCTRYQRAISADCKGLVLLHTISWSTFGRYSITKTQVLSTWSSKLYGFHESYVCCLISDIFVILLSVC